MTHTAEQDTRDLIVQGEEPLNAEADLAELVKHPVTPSNLTYCRNHGGCPMLDESTFQLTVDGLVENGLKLSVRELQKEFPRADVVAALQCAGNRRKKMVDHHGEDVEGIKWAEATICNVRWVGARLRDVLLHAGVRRQSHKQLHLCFACSTTECQEDRWFGASVPIEKALDEDGGVLVAYEMNGETLPPTHGYPLRMVVPGHSGARWVKWVDRITVSEEESPNFYQQHDYKILPPEVKTKEMAEGWWSKVPPIQENPLNSVVATHKQLQAPTDALPAQVLLTGYAVSGLVPVAKVETSIDQGHTWQPARIMYQDGRWSWVLWEAEILCAGAGRVTVWSRADDRKGNKQSVECPWNLRGVAYCAVGEHTFEL